MKDRNYGIEFLYITHLEFEVGQKYFQMVLIIFSSDNLFPKTV